MGYCGSEYQSTPWLRFRVYHFYSLSLVQHGAGFSYALDIYVLESQADWLSIAPLGLLNKPVPGGGGQVDRASLPSN